MRLFLKKVLWFSLLVIGVLFIGELVVRSIETPYRYKAEWLKEHGEEVNTLVLGSSHTYYGIMPSVLGDSVFNLANVSQTPEYDLALLREFHPYMQNLKRVIVPISYFTYRDPKLEDMDHGLCVQYKVGMDLPLHSDLSLYNLSITDFKAYSGRLRNLFMPQELNLCDSLGFGLGFDLGHREADWKEKAVGRAHDLTQTAPGRAEEVENVIGELIGYCNRNNIEVVIITTPVIEEFRNAVEREQYHEMREGIAKVKRNPNVRYYDFFSSDLFIDEDFHDSDHLSDTGARKLSGVLRDSLLTKRQLLAK